MTIWPLQSDCDAFYGNPRNRTDPATPSPKWEADCLVRVVPPFAIFYETQPVRRGLLVHAKVADSLGRVLARIWEASGRSQAEIDAWGVSAFGGAYNFRLMRGCARLSMHSYGCAVDLDPDRNGFRDPDPHFAGLIDEVVAPFEAEGWVWGGRWSAASRDGMHFQAARVG